MTAGELKILPEEIKFAVGTRKQNQHAGCQRRGGRDR